VDRARELFKATTNEANAELKAEIGKLKQEIADLQMMIKMRR
jgi:hypothetical protein